MELKTVDIELRSIELYHVVMPLKHEFTTSFGSTLLRHCILVRVVDRYGEEGWGEIPVDEGPWYSYEDIATAWHIVKDFIAPKVLESTFASPLDYWNLDIVKRIRGHNMAKSGIEQALWDLYARKLGKPLYQVLGGVRNHVVSGVSLGITRTVEELLKMIAKFLDEGYRRIKIKIKPGWDVEVVDRIRKEFPDIPLQVDANAAYTLSDIPILKKLDEYNLLMIEQPLHYDDLIDHATLAKHLKTPICLDESIKSVDDARKAIDIGACKIINIKPARVGGLYPSLQIHNLCYARNIAVWIGGMLETGIGRAHLVALGTLPNVRYPSDVSASDRYYEEDIVTEPWKLQNGVIYARNIPGIGVEIDWRKLVKYLQNIHRITH